MLLTISFDVHVNVTKYYILTLQMTGINSICWNHFHLLIHYNIIFYSYAADWDQLYLSYQLLCIIILYYNIIHCVCLVACDQLHL